MGRWMIISLKRNIVVYLFPGFSLSGQSLPENELAPYIQQAIDQVGSFFESVAPCSNSHKFI